MATRTVLTARVQRNLGGRTDKDTVINDGFSVGLEEAGLVHDFRDAKIERGVVFITDNRFQLLPPDFFHLLEARVITLGSTTAVLSGTGGGFTVTKTDGSADISDAAAPFTAVHRDGSHWIRALDPQGDVLSGYIGTGGSTSNLLLYDTQGRTRQNWLEGNVSAFATTADSYIIYAESTVPTGSWPLRVRDKKTLTDTWPDVEQRTSGSPVWGHVGLTNQVSGVNQYALYLYPTPDKAYLIRYTYIRLLGDEFDTGSDEQLVNGLDNFLVDYATGFVYQSVGMYQDAAYFFQRAGGALSRVIRADSRRPGVRRALREHDGLAERISPSVEPWNDPFVKTTI